MNLILEVRAKVDVLALDGREITLFQREGDEFDTVRLAFTGELGAELARVVGLSTARPRLATALAVWTSAVRTEVLEAVRQRWIHFEREVIA